MTQLLLAKILLPGVASKLITVNLLSGALSTLTLALLHPCRCFSTSITTQDVSPLLSADLSPALMDKAVVRVSRKLYKSTSLHVHPNVLPVSGFRSVAGDQFCPYRDAAEDVRRELTNRGLIDSEDLSIRLCLGPDNEIDRQGF